MPSKIDPKTKKKLSWGIINLNILACILWLTYGIILEKPSIYISNIIYFIANITITAMKGISKYIRMR